MKLVKFFKVTAIACATLFVISCSQMAQPSADEVMAKMQSGENLEVADYNTMLDYLEVFCDAGEMSDSDYESGRMIGEQYPYFMSFTMALDNAPQEVRNEERFSDIQKRFMNLMSR